MIEPMFGLIGSTIWPFLVGTLRIARKVVRNRANSFGRYESMRVDLNGGMVGVVERVRHILI